MLRCVRAFTQHRVARRAQLHVTAAAATEVAEATTAAKRECLAGCFCPFAHAVVKQAACTRNARTRAAARPQETPPNQNQNKKQQKRKVAPPVCLVTGASRGIGRAIALALGAQGATVAVNYSSSPDKAEEVAAEVRALGGDAMVVGANVADKAELDAMFKAVVDAYGTLDVLVNNAGITRDTLMARMKPEQWQSVIDTNLTSVFYATQVCLFVVLFWCFFQVLLSCMFVLYV